MAHVISFRTARFDVSRERPNPTNPIAGESVLNWLRDELGQAGYAATEPDTEDWGWYMDVTSGGASYLVGASADADGPEAMREWTVQIHRRRSLTDRMLGRNRMAAGDPLSALIDTLIRADQSVTKVSVEKEAP